MQVLIQTIPEIKLVGKRMLMSFADNQTQKLWQSFMPQRKLIQHVAGSDYFSLEVYSGTDFFNSFNPQAKFEKWACLEVSSIEKLPAEMETLTVPKGLYAVITYKGLATDAHLTYRYILSEWLPSSDYLLDDRPHFARVGEKYKNNDASSEEELYFPIKLK